MYKNVCYTGDIFNPSEEDCKMQKYLCQLAVYTDYQLTNRDSQFLGEIEKRKKTPYTF